jgi:hypothetical protein
VTRPGRKGPDSSTKSAAQAVMMIGMMDITSETVIDLKPQESKA